MGTPGTTTTRAQQRQDTRERILDAAVESFSEFGFRAASTREIAGRAGTNQGLITYHFQTKDELWRAAVDRVFGAMRETLGSQRQEIDSMTDLRERSRAFVRVFVRYSAAHPEVFRLLVEEGKHADDRMQWLVDRHLLPFYADFRRLAGAFRDDLEETDLPHAFYAMAGAASVIFAVVPECRRLTGVDPRQAKVIEAHADFVAKMLVP